MSELDKLSEINRLTGESQTIGLSHEVISDFLAVDPRLKEAINSAYLTFHSLYVDPSFKQLLLKDETSLIKELQSGITNFYEPNSVNPYVPIAGVGPWLVTSHGAVLHDSGGYGMLGFGQNPPEILKALENKQVMANVMTASFSQRKIISALNQEIGQTRGKKSSPYQFLFLNSGSEGVTLASRLSDLNAHYQTQNGAQHQGKPSQFISLKGSFHGRTDRPAQVSDSCNAIYRSSLKSFQERENLITVSPNNIDELEQAFHQAEAAGVFIESFFMEPVMGEGQPGLQINPEFYLKARELTKRHGSLLIIDSVQAGFRTSGYLSIIDYPGFRELPPPDIEVFSKAINGGQYPLSVIGIGPSVQRIFKVGLYGNTMTTNPRALDVGIAILAAMTDQVRHNIVEKGQEAVEKFLALQTKFPDIIEKVQGTGLLFSVYINPEKAMVVGDNGLEIRLRKNGIGVIHGGKNALRFTPHFGLTTMEIELISKEVERVISTIN